MANHKATLKSARKNAKRRVHYRYYAKTTRNAMRDILKMTDKEEAQKQLPTVISMIDKLAKRNVIHKNKAANLKSKIQTKVNALG